VNTFLIYFIVNKLKGFADASIKEWDPRTVSCERTSQFCATTSASDRLVDVLVLENQNFDLQDLSPILLLVQLACHPIC